MTSKIMFDEFGPEKILNVYDSDIGMRGFAVIDNTALGPGKGGIRMTSTVTVEEVARLARTMTWKCALAELPFGGGKSGIVFQRGLKRTMKKKLIQSFSKAIKPICPKMYVAAPDVGTGEREMRWFAEANGSLRSCTGKPANMRGIPHEYGSTGFGVFHATLVAAEHMGIKVKGATAAIEGFGNVGTFTMKCLTQAGAKVVAVSDSKGCIHNPLGLDFGKLSKIKKRTGAVINYEPGEVLRNEELLELPVDILIPAALPDTITAKNVEEVKARLVVEAANIPMTPDIEEILDGRGIMVVPDFVANAGGVISSYVEYRGYDPKRMFPTVERKVKRNTAKVLERASKKKIKPRDAAMEIAVERVRRAMKRRKRRASS